MFQHNGQDGEVCIEKIKIFLLSTKSSPEGQEQIKASIQGGIHRVRLLYHVAIVERSQ